MCLIVLLYSNVTIVVLNSKFQFVQIVPDMDDEYFFNAEKQSIRDSGRSLKKYGSTCNHVRNNEHLIRHELNKTDTLQGIALKYGCTVGISMHFSEFITNK